jgi:hypothetical protein
VNVLEAAAATPSAGGAPVDQIFYALGMAAVLYVPLGWFIWRETGGHQTVIGRAADWMADLTGLARWAALPYVWTVVALLLCAFGVYWDVPLHMQKGRDPGPLANPSHYPILFGILMFLMAGIVAAVLARKDLPRRTLRVTRTWRVPMSSLVLIAAGLIAAAGFPLDDLWHRLFGQDVTEWGPTHTMMIGGAVTCCLSFPLFVAESAQAGRSFLGGRWPNVALAFSMAMCIIPVGFLMEFDLGVPQFPGVTLYIISGFLTGWIFVSCRIVLGRGGALFAWTVYVGIRLIILLMTLPVTYIHHARFMLWIGPALVIEVVAFLFKRHGAVFAAVAGALAAAIGMAVEQLWMNVFMPLPLPLPASHLPFLLGVGAVAGVGGGLLAIAWANHLLRAASPTGVLPAPDTVLSRGLIAAPRFAGLVGVVIFLGLMAAFAPPKPLGEFTATKKCDADGCATSFAAVPGSGAVTGTLSYADNCIGQDKCLTKVTVRLHPADAADDAVWFTALAWQGYHDHDDRVPGTGMTATEMVHNADGSWTTRDPLPIYGTWKTMMRLHLAPSTMVALALHFPEDKALSSDRSGEVLVPQGKVAPFATEPSLLQRERKDGVPGWLWGVMYAAVLGIWLLILALYGWCFVNAGRAEPQVLVPRVRIPVRT